MTGRQFTWYVPASRMVYHELVTLSASPHDYDLVASGSGDEREQRYHVKGKNV